METDMPPTGVQEPILDVQVLQGLETYIATEDFLHKLEHAAAEWIDLSEHQHIPSGVPAEHDKVGLVQAPRRTPASGTSSAVAGLAVTSSGADQQANNSSNSRSRFFSWRQSSATASGNSCIDSASGTAAAVESAGISSSSDSSIEFAGHRTTASAAIALDSPASCSTAASAFELIEQQPPLHQDIAQQEPFVLVSAEDAIEGMAYYIALYLSRAPEARYMEPKQLQAALKQTFMAIRRSRYKVLWDWGRCLYRWGAVSYSALQLYEHPWLVRAVVAAIWTSSKMAFGLLV